MAFGILGLAACLCCKDVDSKMTNKVRYPWWIPVYWYGEIECWREILWRSRCIWRTLTWRTETNITRIMFTRTNFLHGVHLLLELHYQQNKAHRYLVRWSDFKAWSFKHESQEMHIDSHLNSPSNVYSMADTVFGWHFRPRCLGAVLPEIRVWLPELNRCLSALARQLGEFKSDISPTRILCCKEFLKQNVFRSQSRALDARVQRGAP